MDGLSLNTIMLSKISQRKTNTVWYHLYVEHRRCSKLVKITKRCRLTDTDNKLVVTSGEREGGGMSMGGIPWTEEPGGLQSVGLQRVGHA